MCSPVLISGSSQPLSLLSNQPNPITRYPPSLKMKLTNTITTLLAASPALAFAPYTTHFRRDTGTCNIAIPSSAGGRKIAIVIDSSGSMSSSDPFDLRITAGRSLNDQLVSAATGSKKADLVTVVE